MTRRVLDHWWIISIWIGNEYLHNARGIDSVQWLSTQGLNIFLFFAVILKYQATNNTLFILFVIFVLLYTHVKYNRWQNNNPSHSHHELGTCCIGKN